MKKHFRNIKKYAKRQKALLALPPNTHAWKKIDVARLVPVTCPMALISQIQRSGGSLLSQLFDFHPQIHAHPDELKIGYPKKYHWPDLDLSQNPNRWFKILFENSVIDHAQKGYKKEPTSDITFPFTFLSFAQKKIFLECMKKSDSIQMREVLDAYMTSYFGAWLNNKNYNGNKAYITAFTPRLSEININMERFFNVYPDGRLISIVRDPKNWFPSALRHNSKIKKDKYSNIQMALDRWINNIEAMIRNHQLYQERMCIIKFEDLVLRTKRVMQHLSAFLGIEYDDILLVPTFNGAPIPPNSSFNDNSEGIIKKTAERYKTLSAKEIGFIEQETGDIYHRVLERVTRV